MPRPQLLAPQCEETCDEDPFICPVASDVITRNLPLRLVKFSLPAEVVVLEEPERIIAGYANVEIVDAQGEIIPAKAWIPAFAKFMENQKFRLVHVFHTDIPVGEVLWNYRDHQGRTWQSHVDKTGLFVVVRLRKDLIAANRVWDAIQKGELKAFSIGGLALERRVECSGGRCYRIIPRLELHSITICERGANPSSLFTVVKSIDPVSLLRMQKKALRQKMSEEEILDQAFPNQNPEIQTKSDEPEGEPSPPTSKETQKQSPNPTDASPLLLEIKASLDRLASEIEKMRGETEKARKPKFPSAPEKGEKDEEEEEKAGKDEEEEEEEDEEKARKPKEEEEEKQRYPKPERYPYPEKYPYPGRKGKGRKDEEEEEDEEKARKPGKSPFPVRRKGEITAIDETELSKMVEERAAEVAEAKVTEILQKSLGKTEKRGEVPDIGGPRTDEKGPISALRMPLAKLGSMNRQDFFKVVRGGS